MDNLNFSELGVKELKKQKANRINGGSIWSNKIGGWAAVVAAEITDVITSGGENLRKAYRNGRKAGLS